MIKAQRIKEMRDAFPVGGVWRNADGSFEIKKDNGAFEKCVVTDISIKDGDEVVSSSRGGVAEINILGQDESLMPSKEEWRRLIHPAQRQAWTSLLKAYHVFLGKKQDVEWLMATKEDELIKEFLDDQDRQYYISEPMIINTI